MVSPGSSALLRIQIRHGLAGGGLAHVRIARGLEVVLYGAVNYLLEGDGTAPVHGEGTEDLEAVPVLVCDPVGHAVHGAASRR